MLDMQVIVRLLVLRYSASITCISSIMRPDRAKVFSDYPHNADERTLANGTSA